MISEQGGVDYVLKGGYDPAYHQCAPGKLLIHEELRRAFALGLDSYELLGEESPDKLAWTDAARVRSLLHVYSASLPGRLGWLAHCRVWPLVARVRSRR